MTGRDKGAGPGLVLATPQWREGNILKQKQFLGKSLMALLFGLQTVIFGAGGGWCAAVDEKEAVAIADLWYALELKDHGPLLNASEKTARIQGQTLRYLVAGNELAVGSPEGKTVLAYVVTYGPKGYVVVSGDDRLDPIPVFATESEFRWDEPERNFLRYFLETEIVKRWQSLEQPTAVAGAETAHPHWSYLRSQLPKLAGPLEVTAEAPGGTYVLLDTALWDQGQYYNTEVAAHNGNNSSVPTGCTATAMAIQMQFHRWPPVGSGSHSYNDVWRSLQYSHTADFGSHTYDWDAMPATNVTSANAEVADLMYHCGVAVEMDYELNTSNKWPSATATNSYFRYKGTVELTSGHAQPLIDSIRAGLPVVISSSAHTVLAAGYRDSLSPYYYLNVGWSGGSNGWYNLDQIPGGDLTIDRSYPYSSPDNYVFVDAGWNGTQLGTLQNPYKAVSLGVAVTPAGGQLLLKAGAYTGVGNSPITINTPMTITSFQGEAVLGP